MLIAVTGANGFVGQRVVGELRRRTHSVIAYTRRQWDLRSGPLESPPEDVAAVVHCAARVSDWGPAAAFVRDNVDGTRAVLDSFRASPRFVYVSTASVYDPWGPKRMVREDASYASKYLNSYAHSKMLAERVVRSCGRPTIIVRPHAVYGPGDRTLLPRLLAARRFGRLVAVGDGRNLLSVTHVDNLVQAIVRAVEGDVRDGIFNVADAETVALDKLLRTVLERLRLPTRVSYLPARVAWPMATALERVYGLARSRRPPLLTPYIVSQISTECTLDIERARTLLGYAPTFDCRTGPL